MRNREISLPAAARVVAAGAAACLLAGCMLTASVPARADDPSDDAGIAQTVPEQGESDASSADGAPSSDDDLPAGDVPAAGGEASAEPVDPATEGAPESSESADEGGPDHADPSGPADPTGPVDPIGPIDPPAEVTVEDPTTDAASDPALDAVPSDAPASEAAAGQAADAAAADAPVQEDPGDEAEGTSFDLRDLGLLTPVRDQTYYGICWSFASMASLESSVLRSSGVPVELSPFQAAYFMVNGDDEQEFASGGNPYAYLDPYTALGAVDRLIASLAAGKGAAEVVPGVNDWGAYFDLSLREERTVRLTDSISLYADVPFWETPSVAEKVDLVKHLVETEGPVVVSLNADVSTVAYNPEHSCFYTAPDSQLYHNHVAAIVGWDDDYPRENFNETMRPERDGAWLIKNSWGTWMGEDGYFWVSCEDTCMAEYVLQGELARSDEEIHQFDETGWSNSMSLGGTGGYLANTFTSARPETLDRIMFCTTGRDAYWRAEVYLNPTDASDPRSGELVASQEGWSTWPGYHTVALDAPVALSAGDAFAVVLYVDNASYPYLIAVETFTPDPELAGMVPTSVGYDDAGNPEVSLVSSDGQTWENPAGYGRDLPILSNSYVTNVCLKALTVSREETPEGPDEPGGAEEPGEPTDPENPGGAEGPGEPENPGGPGEPTDPENPGGPTDPDNPGGTEGPEGPGDPDEPGESGTPADPDAPASEAGPSQGQGSATIPTTGDNAAASSARSAALLAAAGLGATALGLAAGLPAVSKNAGGRCRGRASDR